MPIYEYSCTACDHRFETLQKVHDEPLKDCPECHSLSLKKLATAPSFSFKGSGWYKDLYGSSGSGSSGKESGGLSAAAGSAAPAASSSSSTASTSATPSSGSSSTSSSGSSSGST